MTATGTAPITPQGIRDGDPQVLAALAARRGPAVLAFAEAVCEPTYVVRAAADAFARFRALVADPATDTNVHPDALLLRCARRAALDLSRPGPDLGCGPATELLAARGEAALEPRDASLLERHLAGCGHCSDLASALEAADAAYRSAEDAVLEPSTLAPMVAALAAAAPVVVSANGGGEGKQPVAPPAVEPAPPEPEPEPEAAANVQDPTASGGETDAHPEPKPEPAANVQNPTTDGGETDVHPEPEPKAAANVQDPTTDGGETDVHPEPEPKAAANVQNPTTGGGETDVHPEDELEEPAPDDQADEPEHLPPPPEPESAHDPAQPELLGREEPDPEPEIPIGTRRLTGAPAAYYEVPPPQPRRRRKRAEQAARGAAAAASLGKRASEAARKRLERQSPPPPTPEPFTPPAPEPEPEPETRSWAVVESIEFPAAPEPEPFHDEDDYDPLAPRDDLDESAARAAARHYRRLRHRQAKAESLPSDGRPPRLLRPTRDRGVHLPLSAHGPRDLALPAGLVVLAVLVIMAVSGVFGGGSETPATGTGASTPPEVSLVSQSVTRFSLEDAQRVVDRMTGTTP